MTRALVRREKQRVHVASLVAGDAWIGICGRSLFAQPVCPVEEAPAWAEAHERELCAHCRGLAILAGGDA